MLQEWLVNINSILYIMYLVKEIYNVKFYKKKRGLLRGILDIFLMFFLMKNSKKFIEFTEFEEFTEFPCIFLFSIIVITSIWSIVSNGSCVFLDTIQYFYDATIVYCTTTLNLNKLAFHSLLHVQRSTIKTYF